MKALINFLLSIVTLAIALIPFWFFCLVKTLLSPEDFWQKFAVYAAGICILGVIQIIFLFVGIIVLLAIWTDSY